MSKKYKSVSAMVEGISQDPAFANKTLVKINEKQASQILKLTKEVEKLKKTSDYRGEQIKKLLASESHGCKNEDKMAKGMAQLVEVWMKTYYGPKCGDFEPDCICCQVWKAYEKIFDLH